MKAMLGDISLNHNNCITSCDRTRSDKTQKACVFWTPPESVAQYAAVDLELVRHDFCQKSLNRYDLRAIELVEIR